MISQHLLERHCKAIIAASVLLVLMVAFFALAFGAVPVRVSELSTIVFGNSDSQQALIVHKLRVPRTLMALSIGALMACCGAMTQGLFRNPLADPSLIGVSSGATAGASLMIVLFSHSQWALLNLSAVSLGAFVGGIIAVLFVYRIATSPTGTSVATMLLAGIGVTFVAASLSNILEFTADNEMLRRISLWRMGGLDSANMARAWVVVVTMFFVLLLAPAQYAALNALLLGESEARHLGIDIARVKLTIIILVAAGVGASVAMAGTIAFVGLVVPHMIRMLVGANHRYLIPLSASAGALLLVVADSFARTIIAPTELPVGLVTAVIGAPIFISLLRHRHSYGMQ